MRVILIIANETLASPSLAAAVAERLAHGPAEFVVVVPATPVEHRLTWDEDEAIAGAQERLDGLLERLRELGATASGEVGHRDPVTAAEDAIRSRPVDEVLLSTLPVTRSRWLRQDVPSRLRSSLDVSLAVVTAQPDVVPATSRRS
jgi:GABA permease